MKIKTHFIRFYFAFHSTFTIFIQVPHPAELVGVKGLQQLKQLKSIALLFVLTQTPRVLTLTPKPGNRAITTLTTVTTDFALMRSMIRPYSLLPPKMRRRKRKRLMKSRYRLSDPNRAIFWASSVMLSASASITFIFWVSYAVRPTKMSTPT